MVFVDTHTHLYLNHFNADRHEVVDRALKNNVNYLLLPNIDSGTIPDMLKMYKEFPGICFPMIGLHPGSVKENYEEELIKIENYLGENYFIAIGECGIDLYRGSKYKDQQMKVFETQLIWAKGKRLPLVIHSRDSFNEIFSLLDKYADEDLSGVFHSFTGNKDHLSRVLGYGFYVGINGIVSFKNSDLIKFMHDLPVEKVLLETDSPFLAPVPERGKRNESSFLPYIAQKLAEIYSISIEEIADITTKNAKSLFNFS